MDNTQDEQDSSNNQSNEDLTSFTTQSPKDFNTDRQEEQLLDEIEEDTVMSNSTKQHRFINDNTESIGLRVSEANKFTAQKVAHGTIEETENHQSSSASQ